MSETNVDKTPVMYGVSLFVCYSDSYTSR